MDQTQDNHKKDPKIKTCPLFFSNQSKKLTIHQKYNLLYHFSLPYSHQLSFSFLQGSTHSTGQVI